MAILSAVLTVLLGALPAEKAATTVQATDSPVRLDRAMVLSGAEGPPVLLYSATNLTDDALDQFTIIAFIFSADGVLKARQTAPGRRTLDPHGTKYSTLVLDGSAIDATDQIVVAVNQAQRVNSDAWWRADVQPAAEAAVRKKKP